MGICWHVSFMYCGLWAVGSLAIAPAGLEELQDTDESQKPGSADLGLKAWLAVTDKQEGNGMFRTDLLKGSLKTKSGAPTGKEGGRGKVGTGERTPQAECYARTVCLSHHPEIWELATIGDPRK